jgi:2-amino-4-hydroxy-6-hydroxymethyldihydropteridine diphosphokinase
MTSNIPSEILIALGANMPSRAGPPALTLKAALAALTAAGVDVLKVSSFFETAAWPDPADPPFTNAAASLRTSLQPVAVLELLHAIETDFGRVRSRKNAPRTLDLDLLAYGDVILDEPGLILPHPRLAERRFVLEPLAEIAPGWRHPVTGLTPAQMLATLTD